MAADAVEETQLRYNFSRDGRCAYGEDCTFKHGPGDRRDVAKLRRERRSASRGGARGRGRGGGRGARRGDSVKRKTSDAQGIPIQGKPWIHR